jgi:ABC-type long-subunit fatty acid transport system fused permease/ATPase subunit
MANFTLMTVIIGFTLGILGATVSVTNMPLLGIIERLIFLNAVIWSIAMGTNLIILKTGKTAGEER